MRREEFHDESSEIHHYHAYIAFLTGLFATQSFPSGELKELTVSSRSPYLGSGYRITISRFNEI